MSAPAPSPPAGSPPEPPPPPPPPPPEGSLFYCYECGRTVDLHRPRPIPYSSPLRVCPCLRGFLEDTPPPPPPPPPPVLLYCHECGATVDLHGPPPNPPSSPHRVCLSCCRGFLDENPPPPTSPPSPPPPPPFLGSGSSSSEFSDDPDDYVIQLLGTDFNNARGFLSRFANQSPNERALAGDFATVAAMTVLRESPGPRGVGDSFNTILQRQLVPAPSAGRGGEPPAPAASIAALPTVEVAEAAAACAICKEDLPLASQARKLPCAHLYHSSCIVTWLEMHNSCPVCRFRIPSAAGPEGAAPSEQDSPPTRITIRFTTSTRHRGSVHGAAPISASPTQLAQALTGDGAGGPANSGETVSSEWPPHPESDAVMSEAREGDGFFD